jgi:hypothetical protein
MMEKVMPTDLPPAYISRHQKDRFELIASIFQISGITLLALLLSVILLIASVKYGVATDPETLMEQPY